MKPLYDFVVEIGKLYQDDIQLSDGTTLIKDTRFDDFEGRISYGTIKAIPAKWDIPEKVQVGDTLVFHHHVNQQPDKFGLGDDCYLVAYHPTEIMGQAYMVIHQDGSVTVLGTWVILEAVPDVEEEVISAGGLYLGTQKVETKNEAVVLYPSKGTEEAVKEFQKINGLVDDGIVGPATWDCMGLATTDDSEKTYETSNGLIVHRHFLPEGEYKSGITNKEYVFIHHTAGWHNPYKCIDNWGRDSRGAVCTEFVLGGQSVKGNDDTYDGVMVQAFPDGHYGWHLGKNGSQHMHTHSVGIEVCNFGYIKDGKTYAGTRVAESEIVELDKPFKGFKFWHRYSDAQIEQLRLWLHYIAERDAIELEKGLAEEARLADLQTAPLGEQRAEITPKPTGPQRPESTAAKQKKKNAMLRQMIKDRVNEIDKAALELDPDFQAAKAEKQLNNKINILQQRLDELRAQFGDDVELDAEGKPTKPKHPKIKDYEDRIRYYKQARDEVIQIKKKEAERDEQFDAMQKGLTKFSKMNAKAYMTLLD